MLDIRAKVKAGEISIRECLQRKLESVLDTLNNARRNARRQRFSDWRKDNWGFNYVLNNFLEDNDVLQRLRGGRLCLQLNESNDEES